MTRGQLPKAYLRIDPNIDQTHPDNLDGFLRLICAANRQPVRGTFRSKAVLEALLGKAAVTRLVIRRDVVEMPDASVVVPGWNTWQEGDLTVGERVRRFRDRHASGNGDVTLDVTPPALPSRYPASEARDSEAVRRLGSKALSDERETPAPPDDQTDDPAVAFQERTGRFPTPTFIRWLDDLGEAHGSDRVLAAIRSTAMTGSNPKTYLEGIRDRLRAENHAAEKREAADEKVRLAEKRAKPTPLRPAPVTLTREQEDAELRAYYAAREETPA